MRARGCISENINHICHSLYNDDNNNNNEKDIYNGVLNKNELIRKVSLSFLSLNPCIFNGNQMLLNHVFFLFFYIWFFVLLSFFVLIVFFVVIIVFCFVMKLHCLF